MASHKTLLQSYDSSVDPAGWRGGFPHTHLPIPSWYRIAQAETLRTSQAWESEVHEAEVPHREWLCLGIGIAELGPRSFMPEKRQGRGKGVQGAHHGCTQRTLWQEMGEVCRALGSRASRHVKIFCG